MAWKLWKIPRALFGAKLTAFFEIKGKAHKFVSTLNESHSRMCFVKICGSWWCLAPLYAPIVIGDVRAEGKVITSAEQCRADRRSDCGYLHH